MMTRTMRVLLAVVLLCSCAMPLAAQERTQQDYSRIPARTTVDWVRDGVVYEIFPRVFSDSGDFNGVTAQLDRLQSLGVTILWFMPIHPIGKDKRKGVYGSPYAVQDFYAVNPDYGTKDDFKRLVTEAHRRGMKVIIDIVANHTAWDSVMMKTPELYTKDRSGKIVAPVADWTDVADLDYGNPQTRRYMVDMLKYWVREFDLDGFRCDVAGMVPTDFWETARAELEREKPGIAMLAEAHQPDLLVKAFDFDYSWPMVHAYTKIVADGEPASILRAEWEKERARFPRGALHMRFTDNHDERRAIARLGERAALASAAFALTIDGVPLLYNGMEVGDTAESGAPALFGKIPITWEIAERRPEFPRFFEKMIALRARIEPLRRGETVWIPNSDEKRVVTYSRKLGDDEVLVAINLTSQQFTGSVRVRQPGRFKEITPSVDGKDRGARLRTTTLPAIDLDPWEFRLFRTRKQAASAWRPSADLRLLASHLAGHFDSTAQSERDPDYFDIRLHVVPVWQDRTDGLWFYVEQAVATAQDRPYRQRVYQVVQRPDGEFESRVYTFARPLRYAGDWRSRTPLGDLSPDDLTLREGCTVFLKKQGAKFVGGTRGTGCASDLRGAAHASSDVVLSADTLESWDRGFDESGKQVWGATKGGYVFRKSAGR